MIEIKLEDIEKYIGHTVVFKNEDGETTRPRVLNKVEDGLPVGFDITKHSGYFIKWDKGDFLKNIKIFEY